MHRQLFLLFVFYIAIAQSSSTILVTGGAGYIGSHTCKKLRDAGFVPVVYDALLSEEQTSTQQSPCIRANLLDTEQLDKAFAKHQPVAVIHFAALKSVADSVKDPSSYYCNNIIGSLNLLNAMVKHGVKHIVFSSSCSVYGDREEPYISENTPISPKSPYACSKAFVERIIQDYAAAYPIHYMILRYFNVAGIDPTIGLIRAENSLSGLIPRVLLSVLQPQQPLQVFGDDYPTLDGSAVRDYIHVEDIAKAHVLAVSHLQEHRENHTLNLGTGHGYSVFEVIKAAEQATQRAVPYVIEKRRPGDITQAVAQIDQAKAVLGFCPTSSDLQLIVQSEWNDLQSRFSNY